MIGVIDLGISNIGSVCQAVENTGEDYFLVSRPSGLDEVTHLIMPGVGSFAEGMNRLKKLNLINPIKRYFESGMPILGICLGMQLGMTFGNEGGTRQGLGIVDGSVEIFPPNTGLRLPHIGWNSLEILKPHPLYVGIKSGIDFYFVHSFFCKPVDINTTISVTSYGVPFCSSVSFKNFLGVQFHPEKSQRNGLKLLDNFVRWDGSC